MIRITAYDNRVLEPWVPMRPAGRDIAVNSSPDFYEALITEERFEEFLRRGHLGFWRASQAYQLDTPQMLAVSGVVYAQRVP